MDRWRRPTRSSYEHKFLSRLDAMVFRVMNMTPKVGEHDRGKKPYPSCRRLRPRPPLPAANGNSLPPRTDEAGEATRHAQVATAAAAATEFQYSDVRRPPAGGNRYPLSSSLAIADANGADDRGNIKEACAEMKWLSDTKNPSIRTAAPGAASAVS